MFGDSADPGAHFRTHSRPPKFAEARVRRLRLTLREAVQQLEGEPVITVDNTEQVTSHIEVPHDLNDAGLPVA